MRKRDLGNFLRYLSLSKTVFCNKHTACLMLQLAEWTESLKIVLFLFIWKVWFAEMKKLYLHVKSLWKKTIVDLLRSVY